MKEEIRCLPHTHRLTPQYEPEDVLLKYKGVGTVTLIKIGIEIIPFILVHPTQGMSCPDPPSTIIENKTSTGRIEEKLSNCKSLSSFSI